MDDLRSSYATPNQIDSLWTVIGSLRKQLEEVTGRLSRMEAGAGPAATVMGAQVETPAGRA
ncbi:MAG: hypothetical protein JSW43_01960 [Gemmatimonadota bacterium]|nr:MAG: hypothetical protein JSW43_01960 [Gemmatimonadota bacterium]